MKKTVLSLLAALTLIGAMVADVALAQSAKPAASGAEMAGMSRERLARIAPVIKQQVDKGLFPGAVTLVARRGTVVHHEAHGFLDAARTKPMSKDALFRLASMTKPIVTVAAMMLVEQGVIKLNDPIATLLPELKELKVETPNGDVAPTRPVLVHDLMRHTAGFVYAGATKSPRIKQMYDEANIEAREVDITGDEMLRRLGAIPLANQPGTVWEYGIATDVLGLLVERAANKSLDQVLKDMLLEPLGMKDTTFWVQPAKTARVAEAFDSDPQKATMLKAYRIFDNPAGKCYFKGGAGLVGTADDYFKFTQMMLNGGELNGRRFLSKKTVEFMFSDHIVGFGGSTVGSTGPGYGFGLGFAVRQHDGMGWTAGSKGDVMWAGAWGTSFWIDPKEGLVAVLLAQGPSSRVPTRMLYKNLVYGAMVR